MSFDRFFVWWCGVMAGIGFACMAYLHFSKEEQASKLTFDKPEYDYHEATTIHGRKRALQQSKNRV